MVREIGLELFGEMFSAFAVTKPTIEEKRLARALAEDGRRHFLSGEEQRKYAGTAELSIQRAASEKSRRELGRIAVWHYERSAESFRGAAIGFESAAKLQTSLRARRAFFDKANRAARLAAQAELSICEIEETLQAAEKEASSSS